LILHSDTVEEQQDQLLQTITEIITGQSGSVLKTEKWGKKNFKYVIKKQSKGHYCFLIFEAPAAALKDIERNIMYNESILRYNFIRLEKFVADPEEPIVAAEPVAAEPVAAEPVAAEPVAAEPVAAEPVDVAEPVAAAEEPAAVETTEETESAAAPEAVEAKQETATQE